MADPIGSAQGSVSGSVRDLDDVEHELHKRRRGRNLAVGGLLLALAAVIFAVTIVKLGQNVQKPF